jgi:hypothetical protein
MKSKKTLLFILTATFFISSKPAFAKGLTNNNTIVTTTKTSSLKTLSSDKVSILSLEDTAKVSQDQAKQIAKNILSNYFDTTIDDTKFQSNINFTPNYIKGTNAYTWDIYWYDQNETKQVNFNVAVDASTGKVLRVTKFQYDNTSSSTPIATITKEQAKSIANDFLKKINPNKSQQTILIKDENSIAYYKQSSYNFIYERAINNIPFENNSIAIGVDGVTGKVNSYEINWDDNVKAPSSDEVISQSQADNIFNKDTKLNLSYSSYISKPNEAQQPKTKLVYAIDDSSPLMIDATSGTALTSNGTPLQSVDTRDITDTEKQNIFNNAKTIEKLDKPISSEIAQQILEDKIKDLYGDGYEINNINYQEDVNPYMGENIKTWSANFAKKDSTGNFTNPEGFISINALTKQLVSINKYNETDMTNSSFTPKLNWDQAYDKAIQIITKYYPEKIKEINTQQKDLTNQTYAYAGDYAKRYLTFNFRRTVNGVPFSNTGIAYANDGINLSFDAETGELNYLSCLWQDNLELPSPANVITSDIAKSNFLSANKPQLTYLLLDNGATAGNSNLALQLVYSITRMNSPLNNVDAFTGKLLNIYGDNIDNNMDAFDAEIKGSDVENEASILASQGIIDTSNFKLNGEITKLQLIKVLVNAKGFNSYLKGMSDLSFTGGVGTKDSTDYKYIQLAVMYGIIKDSKSNFNGDEAVTREELAKYLIRLLGYQKIAEINGVFKLPYSDSSSVSTDTANYVALAGGLNLIEPTSDDRIRPTDVVTMDELIKAVYTALQNLQK